MILPIWVYAVHPHRGAIDGLALHSQNCVWTLYYRNIWASLFWLGATGHLRQSFHWFLNRGGAEAKPHALPLGTVSNHLPEAQHCSALSAFPPETSHFTLTLSTSRPLDQYAKHPTDSSLSKAYSERIQRALRSL